MVSLRKLLIHWQRIKRGENPFSCVSSKLIVCLISHMSYVICQIVNPFATENVDIRFEGLALTPDVRKNTFFSKKPSQTINIVTSVIFMVEWKVNQFWNAQDFADSKLVYFSFYHKKYGSCDFFNKTSCFKKRRFTSV